MLPCYTRIPMVEDFFAKPETPDVYVDSVKIAVGAYGLTLDMGVSGIPDAPGSEPPPIRRILLARMSPQHALVLARLLQKNVDLYEERVGKIELPAELWKQLGLEP